MAQITINVGTVANDGTGDTLRGAFQNVNANFTELYSNVSAIQNIDISTLAGAVAAYSTANASFNKANSANILAYQSNSYTTLVGTSGNNYTNAVGTAGNNYTNSVGLAGNNYTSAVGVIANSYASSVGVAANLYSDGVGTSANLYASSVGVSANLYSSSVGVTANAYASSVGVSANLYANSVVVPAFNKANTAWDYANTVNTYVTLTGPYSDDSAAATGGVLLMGLYYTSEGNVKIRLV